MNPSDYKIMVVDDDINNASKLIAHLRQCGFRVVGVKTAAIVFKKIFSEQPSLIIIDLMSPRRAGLKVCKDLKSDYATREIPIIMTTAKSDESDRIVALELGVDDFVNKPFNLHELNLRIERSLDRQLQEPKTLRGN